MINEQRWMETHLRVDRQWNEARGGERTAFEVGEEYRMFQDGKRYE